MHAQSYAPTFVDRAGGCFTSGPAGCVHYRGVSSSSTTATTPALVESVVGWARRKRISAFPIVIDISTLSHLLAKESARWLGSGEMGNGKR